LFGKEVDEVVVSGEGGYKEARDFMKMLMPSQLKAIKAHREAQPLFARYSVESQLDAMFSNNVTLKSGGYIVINPTEALVSIDVNSGRSTREHNIEDTALKTNLEAAEEVSRQLRLRDLAGLIVIDFIDMEEHRNNRTVEKRLKDCLKNDRARIQVGRISPFGLMEMSRQRMRTGVLESSTIVCAHCGGSGFVRATSSVALLILRGIEDALLKSAQFHLTVKTRTEVALYILNQKRLTLRAIEERFGVTVTISADDSLHGVNYFTLERGEPAPEGGLRADPAPAIVDEPDEDYADEFADDAEETVESAVDETGSEARSDDRDGGRRGKRRRRRGRGRDRDDRPALNADGTETIAADDAQDDDAEGDGDGEGRRRRRRGRRGGRRNRRDDDGFGANDSPAATLADDAAAEVTDAPAAEPAPSPAVEPVMAEAEPQPRKRGRTRKTDAVAAEPSAETAVETAAAEEKPKRGRGKKPVAEAVIMTPAEPVAVAALTPAPAPVAVTASPPPPKPEPVIEPEVEDPNRPKRTGWWAKAKKAMGGE
ncbi:MAG: ribonuclease E/G, partial [Methylocystis sp.]|nr:ribonuclease E/G [Methylocystis sp.]